MAATKQWAYLLIAFLNHCHLNCQPDLALVAPLWPTTVEPPDGVRHLSSAVATLFERSPKVITHETWEAAGRASRVAYDGGQLDPTESVTCKRVVRALPPVGGAESLEAASLCTGAVQQAIVDPGALVLPKELWPPQPGRAIIWGSQETWHNLAHPLRNLWLAAPIALEDVLYIMGIPVLNDTLSFRKGTVAAVKVEDC